MWLNVRSLTLVVAAALSAAAVLAYASTGAVTAAVPRINGHAQKLTRAERAKALKHCKKAKSKRQRNACERKAHEPAGPETHEGTGQEAATTTTGAPATTTATGTTTGTPGAEAAARSQYPSPAVAPNILADLQKARTVSQAPTAAQVAAGKVVFEMNCQVCHGPAGGGEVGDNNVPYTYLPRAQSVTGVVEQLVEPLGGAPEFEDLSFEQKEQAADYVCVELTKKCGEG
jgi:mono/diheme cytochrome c family protein